MGVAAIAVAVVVVVVICGVVFVVYWRRHTVSCGPVHIQVCVFTIVHFAICTIIFWGLNFHIFSRISSHL